MSERSGESGVAPRHKGIIMQKTIDLITTAHATVMDAIHQSIRDFNDTPEFMNVISRLREAGASLRESYEQALRIKSRQDAEE